MNPQVAALKEILPPELARKVTTDLLLRSLQSRDNDVEEAGILVRNYAEALRKQPKLFKLAEADLDIKLNQSIGLISGKKTTDGRYVVYHNVGGWEPSLTPLEREDASVLAIHELFSMNDEVNSKGYVVIADAKDMGLKHLRKVSISLQTTFLRILTESLPVHISGFYIINTNWAAQLLYNMIKGRLPARLVSILSFPTEEDLVQLLGEDVALNKTYTPTASDTEDLKDVITQNWQKLIDVRDQLKSV